MSDENPLDIELDFARFIAAIQDSEKSKIDITFVSRDEIDLEKQKKIAKGRYKAKPNDRIWFGPRRY